MLPIALVTTSIIAADTGPPIRPPRGVSIQTVEDDLTRSNIAPDIAPDADAARFGQAAYTRGTRPNLQLAQAITPAGDSVGTVVTPTGRQIEITGGQLSGDGANLFHSFEQFGLRSGQIANFVGTPQVQNILGRVVGGDASIIDGILQVSNSQANLFLINPAGILFGQNVRLNLPASFTATTADRVGFGEGWFDVFEQTDYLQLVGNPTQFSFGAQQPGSLVNTGTLAVGDRQSLTLLGGNVINTGNLSATNGRIIVEAVAGQQTVRLGLTDGLLNLEFEALETPRNFSTLSLPALLTGGAARDATQLTVNPDGTVSLRGTVIPDGVGTVAMTGSADVSGPQDSEIYLGGEQIEIIAGSLSALGPYRAGKINLIAREASTQATQGINLSNASLATSGAVTMTAPRIDLTDSTIAVDEFSGTIGLGTQAANIQLTADSGAITLTNTTLANPRDQISLQAQSVTLDSSELTANRDITLLAQDTVEIVDRANPAVAQTAMQSTIQTNENLLIQGSQAVEIQALNQPQSVFRIGGNIRLVSDGVVTGQGRFINGGDFSVLNSAGAPGNFSYRSITSNGIISATGDISFGDYTGRSLKVEAGGDITVDGDITITDPDPTLQGTDPDIAILSAEPALILRAGLTEQPPPNALAASGELRNEPSALSSRTVGRTTFSTSNRAPNPPASPGNITVGDIETNRGPVILSAGGDIRTGDITTGGGAERSRFGGHVNLSAEGDIEVSTLDTTGPAGGDITLNAGETFRATGLIADNPLVSINASGRLDRSALPGTTVNLQDGRGGEITIQHRGQTFTVGPNLQVDGTDPEASFSVGGIISNDAIGVRLGGFVLSLRDRALVGAGTIATDNGRIQVTSTNPNDSGGNPVLGETAEVMTTAAEVQDAPPEDSCGRDGTWAAEAEIAHSRGAGTRAIASVCPGQETNPLLQPELLQIEIDESEATDAD